jgi:hypothetical protein
LFQQFLFSFPTRGSHHATSSFPSPPQIFDLWNGPYSVWGRALLPRLLRQCGAWRGVTPAFLAPNNHLLNHACFQNFPAELIYSLRNPVILPPLTLGARAANPAGTARTRAIAHRVPSQHRGRPPRRESRARRGPAGRSASPSPPSRNKRRYLRTPRIIRKNHYSPLS